MLGAIYGDKAGSIYEYKQTKTIEPVYVEQLISDNFFIEMILLKQLPLWMPLLIKKIMVKL